MSAPLDFSLTDLESLKTEVDTALDAVLAALDAVEKFSVFLPGNLSSDIEVAVKVLTELKALLDAL